LSFVFPGVAFEYSCSAIHLTASYSVIKPLITSVSPSDHRTSTPQPDPGFFRATKVGRCSDILQICACGGPVQASYPDRLPETGFVTGVLRSTALSEQCAAPAGRPSQPARPGLTTAFLESWRGSQSPALRACDRRRLHGLKRCQRKTDPGRGREVRPQAQAVGLPAQGSHQAPRRGRDFGGDRQVLRRRYLDDLAIVVNEPEREIEGPPMRRPFRFMLRAAPGPTPSTVRVHRRI